MYELDQKALDRLKEYRRERNLGELHHGHIKSLSTHPTSEQLAAVDKAIQNNWKMVFDYKPPAPKSDQPTETDKNIIDYCGVEVELPFGLTIIEPGKKLKYAELQPSYDAAMSTWSDALNNDMDYVALNRLAKSLAHKLQVEQKQIIANGAVMTKQETRIEWMDRLNENLTH